MIPKEVSKTGVDLSKSSATDGGGVEGTGGINRFLLAAVKLSNTQFVSSLLGNEDDKFIERCCNDICNGISR